MLTCKQASHLVSQEQDRTLSFNERLGLRMHLWMCRNCRRFERQIGVMRRLLRVSSAKADDDSDARLPDSARARIREAMEEERREE